MWSLSVTLFSLFIVELFAAGIAFGFFSHFKKSISMLDTVVISSFVVEVCFKFAKASLKTAQSTLIALRMSKIVRAVHAITHSIGLKNQVIIARVKRTKATLKASYQDMSFRFEQQTCNISYLRTKATQFTDVESDEHVGWHLREKG